MANQAWGDSGGVATTHRNNNSLGLKPTTEEFNREGGFHSEVDSTRDTQNNNHTEIRTEPQHYQAPIIPLSSTFPAYPPHTHAATAAEIALGIPSPFHNNRTLEAEMSIMAAHHTHHDSQLRTINFSDKAADISSVIESLSEVKERDEDHTSRTSETGLVTSPGRMTPLNDSQHGHDHPRIAGMGIGTPSTVSTAPSTDDASFATADYRLDDSHLPNLLSGTPRHGRSPSWGDDGLLPGAQGGPYIPNLQNGARSSGSGSTSPARGNNTMPWSTGAGENQRVATFRDRGQVGPSSLAPRSTWQTTPPQFPQRRHYDHANHETSQYPPHLHPRKGPSGTSLPGTPPRPRNARQPGQPTATGQLSHRLIGGPSNVGPNTAHIATGAQSNQRSSSEILKTLLRKKACLYEPDTSRAVALVTWLVGRELGLNFGFFSRQQLQSGVHACVSSKIDSGIITRTKVNRCMQIILNSCFHYIIPRSDGSEENGDSFKKIFAQSIQDDSSLLRHLPAPWDDLHADPETIVEVCLAEEERLSRASTPKSSPSLTSLKPPSSPGREKDNDDHDPKRAVLLSFNENVRCAEDVVRCHNEFIRDTANAAQLQLSAQEWRNFFGREASRAPYLWADIGIPIPISDTTTVPGSRGHLDSLGKMSDNELCKFRTSWCAKRYEHDHELCGFAHVEVSGGWLRRNPAVFEYQNDMCPHVFSASDKRVSPDPFLVNECPKGTHCDKAHSMEEISYHPNTYKIKNCTASKPRGGWCKLGSVCPNLHSSESSPRPNGKKAGDRQHHRHQKKNEHGNSSSSKSMSAVPPGSPMMYASPAPLSSFDLHLGMPGLQCLFRRQSSVVRAYAHTPGPCVCVYSCFDDDWGIKDERATRAPKSRSALPSVLRA